MAKKTSSKKHKKSRHQTAIRPIARKTKKRPLEERMLEWEEDDEDAPLIDESLRQKLLKEEFKLRKKQPTAWTKTKYRKFAMFAFNRKKKDETEEEKKESERKQAKKL